MEQKEILMEIKTRYFAFAEKTEDAVKMVKELNKLTESEEFISLGKIVKQLKAFVNISEKLASDVENVFTSNNCKFVYDWFSDEQGGGYCYYGENNKHAVKLGIDLDALFSKSKTMVEFLIFCGLAEYLDEIIFGVTNE